MEERKEERKKKKEKERKKKERKKKRTLRVNPEITNPEPSIPQLNLGDWWSGNRRLDYTPWSGTRIHPSGARKGDRESREIDAQGIDAWDIDMEPFPTTALRTTTASLEQHESKILKLFLLQDGFLPLNKAYFQLLYCQVHPNL